MRLQSFELLAFIRAACFSFELHGRFYNFDRIEEAMIAFKTANNKAYVSVIAYSFTIEISIKFISYDSIKIGLNEISVRMQL